MNHKRLCAFVVIVYMLGNCCLVNSEVRLPPRITAQPESKIYRNDDTITVVCEADGVPEVEFYWQKNGAEFGLNKPNIKRIAVNKGSFIFGPLSSLDSGYYQCFASNIYGKALSRVANLERAVLAPYPPPTLQEYPIKQGDPLKVVCESTHSYPVPNFFWTVSDSAEDKSSTPVELDGRVQLDEFGNLYFSNVLTSDHPDKIYKCNVYNPGIELTTTGSYSKLVIQPGSPGEVRPTVAFSTQSPVIGLKGKTVELQCIFNGFPTPTIKWSRVGGSLPIGRFDKINYDTTLQITDLQEEDEGEYMCSGENRLDTNDVIIQLDVKVAPVFNTVTSQPHNMNKTDGESVSFLCDSYGEPVPNVQWYINGEALEASTPGPRRSISKDSKNLTIINLCKDCGNGATDLMVVQCNSSNNYGYAYSEGYLNVLLKTVLTVEPTDIRMENWDTPVFFPCEATSDDSTVVFMTWYFNGVQIDQTKPWYNVLSTGLEVFPKKKDEKDSAEGEYQCGASNGLSVSSKIVNLYIPETPQPVIAESGFPLWLLILLIVIVVVIFIIILCICCCMWRQRNKGDEYPVDEKERGAGRNPEKEIADNGFHDYQRPEEQPFKGSRASLTSTIKLNDSDDDDDLAEYGEPDTGKFNEDGSFIGQYQEKQRGRQNQYHNDSVV